MMKAVLLDRDGVINANAKHVNKPEDFHLLPGACEAIKRLNDAGYDVFVVTNQGGVGCGYMTEATLDAIHQKMVNDLKKCGATLTEVVACTHHPKAGCTCRKPKPGMINYLAEKYQLDLAQSWMIGDMETDCQAGKAAGVRYTILLGDLSEWADYTAKDLAEAAKMILTAAESQQPVGAKDELR